MDPEPINLTNTSSILNNTDVRDVSYRASRPDLYESVISE